MSWVDAFVARHGLGPAAADELHQHLAAPLSGAASWLDERAGSRLDDAAAGSAEEELRLGVLLGRGAVGEVYRAFDPGLGRWVALKVLRADRRGDPAAITLFQREARVLAFLQHPGIPPVYGRGALEDGRPYVTMLEVVGDTLRQVALDHHHGRRPRALRRRVTLVVRLAEAAGHAHRHGVVHRDIKPGNVLVSPEGTVYLVDWGLAVPVAEAGPEAVGTPGWMAPEGVSTPRSDVWSLGRVLHGLLDPEAVDQEAPVPELPDGLDLVARRALATDPGERFPDGAALAEALVDWLDGADRLDRARALVQEADRLQRDAEEAADEARAHQARAEEALQGVHPFDPVERKREGWASADEAEVAQGRARASSERRLAVLEDALGLAPTLAEALAPLADTHRRAHLEALRAGDRARADAHLDRVRRYDRGAHAAWLAGLARLTLATDPEGAAVTLCRYVERDRQLHPEPVRSLGVTPLDVELPHGQYLLLVDAPGRAPVRYPVSLDRLEHWRGGLDEADHVVYLPALDELGPDEVYVPAGPFFHGADGAGFQSLPYGRVFLPGFVIQRHPVTHGDYLRFLDALGAAGEDADRWAPRERGQTGTFYGRAPDGTYCLVADADGDLWRPDWPVFFVNAPSAEAYAAWWSARTGRPWSLPQELQHEKAARGADGRIYPWGGWFDPTFACVRESHADRPLPVPIDAFAADCSVYGVRGLAGNVRAWCVEPYAPPGGEVVPSQRVLKGGCFFFPARGAHGAARMGLDAHRAGDTVGFRLVRPLDPFGPVTR